MKFHKTLTLLMLATELIFALATWAQQKPFTQEQVSNMVRDGFGDESGAKLIEQRGIDFAPSEDFIQTLKAAGASEAFLKALRAAVAPGLSPARNVAPTFRSARADLKVSATTAAPEPASAKKPLNQVQVFAPLVGQVPSHRVSMLVKERGIDFEPTDEYLQEVRLAGGEQVARTLRSSASLPKHDRRSQVINGKDEDPHRNAKYAYLCATYFSFEDEPTVNSQDELAVATSGSHNLRRRSNGRMQSRDAGLALPGVPHGECGIRGRQAVPLRRQGRGQF